MTLSRIDEKQANLQQVSNAWRTTAQLVAIFALFFVVASLFAGPLEALFFVAVVVLLVAVQARYGHNKLILKLHRATPIPAGAAPDMHHIVETLARRAELPVTPQLYLLDSPVANAFATGGRNSSNLCITRGLLRLLNRKELAGVLAHEIGHVRNGDAFSLGLAASLGLIATSLSWLAFILLALSLPMYLAYGYSFPWLGFAILIFAPAAINLLQRALSRSREFAADLTAAKLLGTPQPLASALRRLERAEQNFLIRIFLPYRPSKNEHWMLTHPPTPERIQRLSELEVKSQIPLWSILPERIRSLFADFHI